MSTRSAERRPFGFTLVELLLVVVILGILSTVGLVNWSKARQQVLDNDAKTHLRILDTKALEYQVDDLNGHYPTSINDVRPTRPDGTRGAPPVPPKGDGVSQWAYCYDQGDPGLGGYARPKAILKLGRPGAGRTFVINAPRGAPVLGNLSDCLSDEP